MSGAKHNDILMENSDITHPLQHIRLLLVAPYAVSGIVDPLFRGIETHFDTMRIIDTHELLVKYLFIAQSFSPSLPRWKSRSAARLAAYTRKPIAFMQRTKALQAKVVKLSGSVDAIFQISSTFRTWVDKPNIPYYMYMDCTSKLGEKYTPQSAFPIEYREDRYRLEGETYRNALRVFAANDVCAESLVQLYGVDADRVVNVGFGVNLEKLPDSRTYFGNANILFVTTDFNRQRGQAIIDAFRVLRKRHPELTLTVVGKDITGDGIRGMNRIPHEELRKLYAEHGIFVMPAMLGGAQSTLEAMAYGCACIVERANMHLSGVIRHEQNGLLVDTSDPEVFAGVLDQAVCDADLRHRIGEQAQTSISDNYSWEQVACRIAAEIKRAAEGT